MIQKDANSAILKRINCDRNKLGYFWNKLNWIMEERDICCSSPSWSGSGSSSSSSSSTEFSGFFYPDRMVDFPLEGRVAMRFTQYNYPDFIGSLARTDGLGSNILNSGIYNILDHFIYDDDLYIVIGVPVRTPNAVFDFSFAPVDSGNASSDRVMKFNFPASIQLSDLEIGEQYKATVARTSISYSEEIFIADSSFKVISLSQEDHLYFNFPSAGGSRLPLPDYSFESDFLPWSDGSQYFPHGYYTPPNTGDIETYRTVIFPRAFPEQGTASSNGLFIHCKLEKNIGSVESPIWDSRSRGSFLPLVNITADSSGLALEDTVTPPMITFMLSGGYGNSNPSKVMSSSMNRCYGGLVSLEEFPSSHAGLSSLLSSWSTAPIIGSLDAVQFSQS